MLLCPSLGYEATRGLASQGRAEKDGASSKGEGETHTARGAAAEGMRSNDGTCAQFPPRLGTREWGAGQYNLGRAELNARLNARLTEPARPRRSSSRHAAPRPWTGDPSHHLVTPVPPLRPSLDAAHSAFERVFPSPPLPAALAAAAVAHALALAVSIFAARPARSAPTLANCRTRRPPHQPSSLQAA